MIDTDDWSLAKRAIAESSPESSVYIGADSVRIRSKRGDWSAKYCVVVVLHENSKHGCKLFHRVFVHPDYGALKQRLLTEVNYAVACATELVDVIGDRPFSIHLDINPSSKHKSNIAVKEALGWVKGALGIDAVIKPEAFAASQAADHIITPPRKPHESHTQH